MGYNTKQRENILSLLEKYSEEHLTADEIVSLLKKHCMPVGKTTVYRYLDKLCAEGLARKYIGGDSGAACYQYIGSADVCEHFHLKCSHCGRLIHLECDFLCEIQQHIFEEHDFTIDNTKTVFYGSCTVCKKHLGGNTT